MRSEIHNNASHFVKQSYVVCVEALSREQDNERV